jgi:hypothetical protein
VTQWMGKSPYPGLNGGVTPALFVRSFVPLAAKWLHKDRGLNGQGEMARLSSPKSWPYQIIRAFTWLIMKSFV